jgi:hypothetical protein
MRIAGVLLVIVALGLTAYTVTTFIESQDRAPQDSATADIDPEKTESGNESSRLSRSPMLTLNPRAMQGSKGNPSKSRESIGSRESAPVALNRGADVANGFRGDIHSLLHGQARLELKAEWTHIGQGRDRLERTVNPMVYSWFTELRPAQMRESYSAHDFSAFLPAVVGGVGQLWMMDSDKVARFLKQFHSRPSMHLTAPGRRAGPDGAIAILRAASPDYLDIAFRIHAEFYLTPEDWPPELPPIGAWYSPAFFTGRILVNTQAGTVDYFRLELPTDKSLNVHLTVDASGLGYTSQAHDIVRVEHMELTGGDSKRAENIAWGNAITPAEAQIRLAKVFYKFEEIDWVPIDQALAQARRLGRPIFAIVSWGSFNDQSC